MKPILFAIVFWVTMIINPGDMGDGRSPTGSHRTPVDLQDASAYGKMTTFACTIPHVCVHARAKMPQLGAFE